MDITDAEEPPNVIWSFVGDLFPGIPGTGGHTDKFAVEVVTYLELSQGLHTFGMSVSADRTDVNDDDGYQVFVGENPRSLFATKVAEFQRIARPFASDQHIENRWTVEAPVAGIYPFRMVYWQTGRAANLQWYNITGSGATEDRLLVNDTVLPFRDQGLSAIPPFQSPTPPTSPKSARCPDRPGSTRRTRSRSWSWTESSIGEPELRATVAERRAGDAYGDESGRSNHDRVSAPILSDPRCSI